MIPYGKQSIDDEDIEAVVKVLKSDFLTCGPEVVAFENDFANYIGAKHAVAVCSATAALHLAMLVAKIGIGDRVVTSPNTFLSSANCAAFVGATPDFADIDPTTYNLCPLELAKGWKDDTKAVIAVAYAGQSPDMPKIAEVAWTKGAIVIEDGCHGIGGGFSFNGEKYKIGAHPWADMTTFSFHPVKSMTTGEGGMLVTNNDAYAAQARMLRNHGIVRKPERFQYFGKVNDALKENGPWSYEMQQLGYNFRITDIQCALGRSQLRRLSDFIKRRSEIVARYNEAFASLPHISTPKLGRPDDRDLISWHLYTLKIDFPSIEQTRTMVMQKLCEKGIGSQVLYIPVHLQPYYQNSYGFGVGDFPNAENYYVEALSLPLFPDLTDKEVGQVIQSVTEIVL